MASTSTSIQVPRYQVQVQVLNLQVQVRVQVPGICTRVQVQVPNTTSLVVVQGPGSFRGLVNVFVQRTVAELRGIKVAHFSDFGLFSPYNA